MKIALYIEDGLEQIVFTPESETEKGILGKLSDGSRQLDIKKGSFFKCTGGWMRHGIHNVSQGYYDRQMKEENDESTMIVLTPITDMTAMEAQKAQADPAYLRDVFVEATS